MPAPKRLKPFTFFGKVPQGITTVDLTKTLVQKFTKTELGGVQDFTGGKYEIFLKTRAAVTRFLEDPTIEVKGSKVTFEYRGTRAKLVRIFGYSAEHQDTELAAALQPYGKIVNVSRESVPGFPTVTTGIRRVKIEMKDAVPNFLDVIDTTVQCEYEGVVRVCRRCGEVGHMGADCETPQCERCGAYGHASCESACPRCGEDHPVRKCRKRTFASVVGDDQATLPEAWNDLRSTDDLTAATTNGDTEAQSSTTCDDGASDAADTASAEEARREAEPAAPENAPTPPSAPAEAAHGAEQTDGPEEASSTLTAPADATAIIPNAEEGEMECTATSTKRKRTRKEQKTGKAARASRDTESRSSKSSDAPKTKKKAAAFLKTPQLTDSESDAEADTIAQPTSNCPFCDHSDCDCSLVSEHSIESTSWTATTAQASEDSQDC